MRGRRQPWSDHHGFWLGHLHHEPLAKAEKPKDVTPQPFNAGGLLNGDANPEFPAGDPDKVAVVAQAPIDKDNDFGSATLTFAFRNNTDAAISHVDWTATATADGKLVATGSSQGTQPA